MLEVTSYFKEKGNMNYY